MHLTSLILLAAAGASAHPSGHAHLHRHAHQKRSPVPEPVPEPNPAVGDLVTATVMGKVVSWTNTYDGKGSPFIKGNKPNKVNAQAQSQATPTPTPSPSSAPAPKESAAAPASSQVASTPVDGAVSAFGVKSKTAFCNGQKPIISRATKAQIAYTGNTGVKGNWGCNMLLVADEQTANDYTYTAKFTNTKKVEQTCTCFNKIGPDNLIDGFFHEGIKWTMAPGATQFVAFDSNTQGGCVCNDGTTLKKTSFGQFAGTWLEVDFDNTSNNGWSGADASSLVAQAYKMDVDGLQVCSAGTCSTIEPFGANDTPRGNNSYLGGMEDLDGIGINHVPGPCRLDVKVGYSG